MGVLPVILRDGGVQSQVLALDAVKHKLFMFHGLVRLESFKDVSAWEETFLSKEPWQFPEQPSLMWPRLDPVTKGVNAGEICDCCTVS